LIASTKPLVPGWSLLTLTKTPNSKPAKSGDGVNYYFEFEAEAGPNNSEENKGRTVTYMVSGGALDAGITDVTAPYLQMMCALTGLTESQLSGQDIDESALVGRKVWANIGERAVDGKTYKDFKCFSPATELPF
jgi:hypothetical protein